jgi:hypothetical protein
MPTYQTEHFRVQYRGGTDHESMVLPLVQIPNFPVDDICHLTLDVIGEVREQLVYEVSELSAHEQVTEFAPGRHVFHGAVQASAVGVPWTSWAVPETHLLADMCLPFAVTQQA